MRFKVLAGKHMDESRRMYSKGDVVETEIDLVKTFGANKFRRLADQDPNAEEHEPLAKTAGTAKAAKHESRKPLTAKEKEMVRRKIQSNEQEPGDEEEEDQDEASAEGEEDETDEAPDEERVQGAEDEDADDQDIEDRGELGKDVTSEFEDFKAAKLKVWRDGNQFNVTTRKDPDKALNKSVPLKKSELKKFLKTHLKEKEG